MGKRLGKTRPFRKHRHASSRSGDALPGGDASCYSHGKSGGDMAKLVYEVRVIGEVGPAARAAFADVAVEVEPPATVLSGELDQAALHGLIERIEALGLELVDIRRV